MEKIKAILLGCGMVGGTIVKPTRNKGVDYLAGFDVDESVIGKTLNDIYETEGADAKIYFVSELEKFIDENKVDICIATPTAPASLTMPQMKLLLSKGINVLTSLADIYVMRSFFPDLYKELDEIAKKGEATFFASGIQDVFWTALPVALSGCCLDIKEIKGTNCALIDYFGKAVADEVCVGWEPDKFMEAVEKGAIPNNVNDFLISLYELAHKLELNPTTYENINVPIPADKDYYFETIDRQVKKGCMVGYTVESTLHTKEGMDLKCNFVSKMTTSKSDMDTNIWEIIGTPNINITTDKMQGEITTGSNMVNRIPDVINARPGVISASEMETPFFKYRNLCEYIK